MHDSTERKATQMKRITKVQFAAVGVSGLLLAGCSSTEEPAAPSTTPGGGNVAAGCEDYATYGTFKGDAVDCSDSWY